MEDISAYGFRVNIVATKTFPFGVILSQFADDSDPFDIPSIQIADKAMGINGDLITWSKATPISITLNMVPNSTEDNLMSILLEANRVGRGKISARDVITLTGIYPSGRIIVMSPGIITDGIPGTAMASSGRMKSKPYSFTFENKIGV